MDALHHSDILTYALNRLASEYSSDREETLRKLRLSMEETSQRRGLGAAAVLEKPFEMDELREVLEDVVPH